MLNEYKILEREIILIQEDKKIGLSIGARPNKTKTLTCNSRTIINEFEEKGNMKSKNFYNEIIQRAKQGKFIKNYRKFERYLEREQYIFDEIFCVYLMLLEMEKPIDQVFKKSILKSKKTIETFVNKKIIDDINNLYLSDNKIKNEAGEQLRGQIKKFSKENAKEIIKLKNDIKNAKELNSRYTNFYNRFFEQFWESLIDASFADINKIIQTGIFKSGNITYELKSLSNITQEWKTRIKKILIYSLNNNRYDCRTGKSIFPLNNYLECLGNQNDKNKKDQIKKDLRTLEAISVMRAVKGAFGFNTFITKAIANNDQIEIVFNKDVRKFLNEKQNQLYTMIPIIIFSIDNNKFKYAFDLVMYIFRYSRFNKTMEFNNLSLVNTLEAIGLINSREKNLNYGLKNKNYKQLIIEPLIENINEIMRVFPGITIGLSNTYGKGSTGIDYLENAKLKFKIDDIVIKSSMNIIEASEKQATGLVKKSPNNSINENKKVSSSMNKLRAQGLKEDGYTNKEIAKELNVNERTVIRYNKKK